MFDVAEVLAGLGVDYTEVNAEYSALCPMHERRTGKADHSPSWWINSSSGVHICFSCGYKGNLLQLICDVNEFYVTAWGSELSYDYAAARTWLSTISEIPPEKLLEMVKALPTYVTQSHRPIPMSEARLAVYVEPPAEALSSRSITADSAKKYGVLWDNAKETWILPLRDPHDHALLGWQEKGTINRTFFNRPAGLKKSTTLFGIENQSICQAILVESPLDCVRLDSAGVSGAMAVCGSSVSEIQAKLLRASDKVICAFDNPNIDSAGKKASKEMCEFARKYGLNLWFFNYGSSGKKDPGDMTDAEIHWGIENAISALYGESAYVYGDS